MPQQLRNLRELSDACQSNISTVSSWIRKSWWRWDKRAPWSSEIVPEILNTAADSKVGRPLREVSDPVGTENNRNLREQKLRQEIRKLRAHADQAETALAKERGSLHDADLCEEEATHRATLFRNAVQNIPMQVVSLALSNGMPHESAPSFQREVEKLVNGCLRYTAASANAQPETGDEEGDEGVVTAGAVEPVAVG